MQTAIVSLIALAALVVVGRKVFAAVRPPKGAAGCPSCASGADACSTSTPAATATERAR
jgi:hypothetical protein